jgi:glutamate-1-semialdehyde 2,1-aminomutase
LTTAFDASCAVYRQAIDAGTTEGLLVGRPAKAVFRKTI